MVTLILFVIFMILWFVDLVRPIGVLAGYAPFLSVLFLALHVLGTGVLTHL